MVQPRKHSSPSGYLRQAGGLHTPPSGSSVDPSLLCCRKVTMGLGSSIPETPAHVLASCFKLSKQSLPLRSWEFLV